jgi:HEAT repeat protein
MPEPNEQKLKIRNWLDKNSSHGRGMIGLNDIGKVLRAAGIEPDSIGLDLGNLLASEKNFYILYDAIQVAGALKSEIVIPQLIQLLVTSTDRLIRYEAMKALGHINSQKAISLGLDLLKSEKADLREWAVFLLVEEQAKDSIPTLLELLSREQDLKIRRITLSILINLEVSEIIPFLLEDLRSPDYDMIVETFRMLKRLQAKGALPQGFEFTKLGDALKAAGIETDSIALNLSNLLTSEGNDRLLPDAIQLAGILQNEIAIPQLIQVLLTNADWHTRLELRKALGRINTEKAISLGFDLLKSEKADLRECAVHLLVEQQAKDSIPTLLELLSREQDLKIRGETLRILTAWGVRESIPFLIEDLKNDDLRNHNYYNFRHVFSRLTQLQAKEALPQVMELLKYSKKEDHQNSYSAIQFLGISEVSYGSAEAMSWLKGDDSWLRYIGLLILEKWNVRLADATLIDLLKDEDRTVRYHVLGLLLKWQVRAAIPQLIETLNDSDQYTREKATKALKVMRAKEAVPHLLKILKEDLSTRKKNPHYTGYTSFFEEVVLALESLGNETVHELIQPELAEVRAEFKRRAENLERERNGDYY